MAVTMPLPKLGMTMESAKIAAWLKSDGDVVSRDDLVLTVETDKAISEVAAPADGILLIRAQAGEELPVGATIAVLAADGDEYDALRGGAAAAGGRSSGATGAPEVPAGTGGEGEAAGRGKVRVAPVARALAAEQGIDLALVRGSGPDGRITKDDVLQFANARAAAGFVPPAPAAAAPDADARAGPFRSVPRTERRRVVAAKMMQAVRESAQTTHSADVDATRLVELREDMLVRFEREAGVRVTITDLVMKLTALAIQSHPVVNSRYTEDADILFEDVHMGMATAVNDKDLLVPVIRDVDKKSVVDIARTRLDYLDRARRGTLTLDEMTGSTFTLSSLGMFGLERFVAILNRPENAILAVGAILDRPWVHDGQIAIRKVMNVTLTYDHRTIYGAEAARFMATLKCCLEDPRGSGYDGS